MEGVQAYGAGMAGGAFDPATFIKKPSVVLRIVSAVLAVIIWSCISGGSWFRTADGHNICLFGGGTGSCSFGVAIAVLALIACIAFLISDAMFERVSSVQQRKKLVIGDLGASAFFALFFFIVFVVLWSKYAGLDLKEVYDGGPPKAAIFFSFFSILTWGGLAFFAWKRYQEGAATAFAPSYDQDFAAGAGIVGGSDYGYSGGPGVGGTESYQEPPFTATNQMAAGPQYKQPAY